MSYVWLPMFPAPMERSALPKRVAEYAEASIAHYWDDTGEIGVAFKRRVIPEFQGEMARDAFVLFDGAATWENAREHVLGWGSTVVATEKRLFGLLAALPAASSRDRDVRR